MIMRERQVPTAHDIEQLTKQTGATALSKKSLSDTTLWLFNYKGTMAEVSLSESMGATTISFSVHLFETPASNRERFYQGMLHENGRGTGLCFGISQIHENMVLLMNSQFAIDIFFEKFDSMLEMMRETAKVIMSNPEDFKRNLSLP